MILISNKLILCVLPGVLLVLASFFDLVIALIMLDLPTLDLPTKQHSGKFLFGTWFTKLNDPIKFFVEKNIFNDLEALVIFG